MKLTYLVSSVCCAFLLSFSPQLLADQIDCGNYRIALSFDGNDHDPDDIVASPMALAIIAEAGVKEKLVFVDFSNHIWGDRGSQPREMRTSIDGACSRWGIDRGICFEVRVSTELNKAKTAFRDAVIEAYNAGATLYYACGGPMEVPYQMVNNLESKYRSVVTVISHHGWNDSHVHNNSHTWDDLKAIAGNSIHIDDQNKDCWSSSLSNWRWLLQKGGDYQWLYDRNPFSDKFDPSDAGMTYFIITGRGNQNAVMSDAQWIFNTDHDCGTSGGNIAPEVTITNPSNGAVFSAPANVTVTVNATDSDGSISKVELKNNGTLVGTESTGSCSFELSGLATGSYTLEAIAYDNENATTDISIVISVSSDNTGGSGLLLEAESYSAMSGVTTETCSEGGENVAFINSGDYLIFSSVDFGTGMSSFDARVATIRDKGSIELRLDGTDGQLIGSVAVPMTGDWQTWSTINGSISGASGVHDLYVVFTGTTTKYMFNLNWIALKSGDGDQTSLVRNRASSLISSPARGTNVRLYDISGRQVFSGVAGDLTNMDIVSLGFNTRGVFMMRIFANSGMQSRRVILK